MRPTRLVFLLSLGGDWAELLNVTVSPSCDGKKFYLILRKKLRFKRASSKFHDLFYMGNCTIADLRYEEKYIISLSTLIFAPTKG